LRQSLSGSRSENFAIKRDVYGPTLRRSASRDATLGKAPFLETDSFLSNSVDSICEETHMPASKRVTQTAFHFKLKFGGPYVLKAFGARHPLEEHTAATIETFAELRGCCHEPTHFAHVAAPPVDMIQLIRVYGTPDEDGIEALESLAIYTPGSAQVYTVDDLAKAILFLHPGLTVLTAESAPIVLETIGAADGFRELSLTLDTLDRPWNTVTKICDEKGDFLKYASGGHVYRYDLDPAIDNLRAAIAQNAQVDVNSDERLRNIRWGVQPGRPFLDISKTTSDTLAAPFARRGSGYQYDLQDGGPKSGVSCEVLEFTKDLELKIRLTNNYIRHCSVFAGFLAADGKTLIPLDDSIWLAALESGLREVVNEWIQALQGPNLEIVFDMTHKLNFLGTLSSEVTFFGVPVSSVSSDFAFKFPDVKTQTISKVRIAVGGLGLPTGSDTDPQAAWIGIGMTALLDFVIPTIALALTVGLPSNKLIGTLSSNIFFLGPIIASTAGVIYDSVINPDQSGKDVANLLTSIGDRLLQRILTASEVAELAAIFVSEEVLEAVPFVGWALKAEAIEAALEQLAQTTGEVLGSARVVEFDIAITMRVRLKLIPKDASGFPATATNFAITAQYTDLKGYVYHGEIAETHASSLEATWEKMPVGGKVKFLVAFYSKEGWLVGKGESALLDNFVTDGQDALVVPPIEIEQLLYPLTGKTTYGHSHLLEYSNGAHRWVKTAQAPVETARDLGSGAGGHVLEALTGIGLNSDVAILGYGWQASGQNVPLIGTDGRKDEPVYTFQNISFGPSAEAALMFTPAGYNAAPQLAYLRSASDGAALSTIPGRSFFYLDPVADPSGSFHLRGIRPVNDASIPADSPSRLFDLSTAKSWGRFFLLPTAMAISAAGTVVAISSSFSKLQILDLPLTATDSAGAKWALLCSGPGTREGMLSSPQAIAIAPNQTILVLEAGNARVQAFSMGGHPAPVFGGRAPYWFPLFAEPNEDRTVTYLSMSIDVQGYIFVLSQEGDGYVASQFRLDVYAPDGQHLLRQRGVNAGAMTVDLWRNLYTLNFQAILGPGQRTEPSVSAWIPSTPKEY
jgi:hypothetical protein